MSVLPFQQFSLADIPFSVEHTGPPPEGTTFREGMIDIETTHLRGDFGFILCVVIKPVDYAPIILRTDAYPGYGTARRMNDDFPLIIDLLKTLECVNRSFGWYSSNFDLKFIRTRKLIHFKERGIENLYKVIRHGDLWRFRTKFNFHNNRLDTWMTNLTDLKKSDLRPKEWLDAAYGDKSAMDYVVAHCILDVLGTEQVYLILDKTPFMRNMALEVI